MATCFSLAILWARSFRAEDRLSGNFSPSLGLRLYSSRGWVVYSKNQSAGAAQNYPWAIHIGSEFWLQPGDARLEFYVPRDFFRSAPFSSISIPHSWLVIVSAILAGALWTGRTRFSLRTLLIATTLVALALGLTAANSNK